MARAPRPKVAPLAAVEVVNPKMPATVEAAELTRLNEIGEIKDCIVDGPLSMDIAIDPEAAIHKGASDRKIVGDADIPFSQTSMQATWFIRPSYTCAKLKTAVF